MSPWFIKIYFVGWHFTEPIQGFNYLNKDPDFIKLGAFSFDAKQNFLRLEIIDFIATMPTSIISHVTNLSKENQRVFDIIIRYDRQDPLIDLHHGLTQQESAKVVGHGRA